jgi:NAD(P)-dependent dehydrogenase (short-subunit alcohol dehydrogenase family)
MFSSKAATAKSTALLGLSAVVGAWLVHRNTSRAESNVVRCAESSKANGRSHEGRIFSKKTVIITGAAGDIGSATAEDFASKGCSVVLVDLPSTKDRLKELSTRLSNLGAGRVVITTGNVTRKDEMEKMVQTAFGECGQVDFFFNNAGIQGELTPVQETSDAVFKKVLDVNVYGVYVCLRLVAAAMMKSGQEGGVIVNTASLAGLQGPPNMAAYAASKFAVVGLTKTAAKDLAPHGIRVCAVAPGLLEGKMWSTQVKGQAECRKRLGRLDGPVSDEEYKLQEKRMIDGTPMKRLGRPSEVASVVSFLCSDSASYLTGIVVPVDGGRLP